MLRKQLLLKNIANSRPECTNHTLFQTKMIQIDTLFQTKMAKKPYPLAPHIPIQPIIIRENKFYKGIWIIIHGRIQKLIYKLSFTEMPSSEGRFKIWRISLCHPSPFPLNNNDQTTPSHKSTQSNTIITWVWLKTLYEVLHAVKQITTFTLMNEGIIFVSKMRV